ncbi:MAG: nicotinate phosphoribosyltransferase [Coprobacillus sp.]|nr:nicotinate phosphoribosyltransferase [Coprobacillus sp.]
MESEIKLKEQGIISRLTNKTFNFDKKLKEGFYSANYFLKSREIVKKCAPNHIVTMQFFQRRDDTMICGLDEAIAILHTFATHPEKLEIFSLKDGDIANDGEPVLKVTGKYEDFGFLESVIDGVLTRRTCVCQNTREVVEAVGDTPVFSMADRQDDYLTQVGDGYASYVAGIRRVSTDAQGLWWGAKGMGTMPHALIEICGGDVCQAGDIYYSCYPENGVTALIDYHNDVVNDSLTLARHLGRKLHAVRVDTSKSLIDHYFDDKDTSGFDPHGVCKELIFALRNALDQEGFDYVDIVVSSSFTAEKIREWKKLGVPVSMYGVGTSLVNNTIVGFVGDLVELDGKPEAKEGRENIFSSRLEKVPYPIYNVKEVKKKA